MTNSKKILWKIAPCYYIFKHNSWRTHPYSRRIWKDFNFVSWCIFNVHAGFSFIGFVLETLKLRVSDSWVSDNLVSDGKERNMDPPRPQLKYFWLSLRVSTLHSWYFEFQSNWKLFLFSNLRVCIVSTSNSYCWHNPITTCAAVKKCLMFFF